MECSCSGQTGCRSVAAPALEPQEAYAPARSAALAGYAAVLLIAGRTIIA